MSAIFTTMLLLSSGPLLAALLFGLCGLFTLMAFTHLRKVRLPKPGNAVHIADVSLFPASNKETSDDPAPSSELSDAA